MAEKYVFLLGVFVLIALLMLIIGKNLTPPGNQRSFETSQLHFAAVTLTGLGLVFILSMGMYFFGTEPGQETAGKEIFEACKTILPPIITLILGFYFGQERMKGRNSQPATENQSSDESGVEPD